MAVGAELDRVMALAWPPAVAEHVGPWTLRYTAGVTRRANSVFAVGEPADLSGAIAAAERFASQRSVPPVFLVSDASTPPSVTDELVSCGFVEEALTWIVQRDVTPPGLLEHDWDVRTADCVSDGWFDTYDSIEGARRGASAAATMRDVLLKPAWPTRFVTVGDRRSILGVGQVVVVGEHACLQCLATTPTARRSGVATVVVESLIVEAASLGARTVFAAVMAENEASSRLFARRGFERSHAYRYLVGRSA